VAFPAVAAAGLIATVTLFGGSAFAATLFSDDFNDGNATGWSTSGGSWSVVTDGSPAYRQGSTGADAKALTGTSTWSNYTVQARVKPIAFNGSGRSVGIAARAQNTTNFYSLVLSNAGRLELRRISGGGVTTLASTPTTVTTGAFATLRLEAFGTTLRGYLNGATTVTASDSTFATGRIGLVASYASAVFDDVVVTDTAGPGPTTSTTTTSLPPTPTQPPVDPQPGRPDGFAAVNALGQNGTTGGAGAPTVTVTNATDLAAYAGANTPYTILVSGRITFDDMITVTANKSILGVGSSAVIDGGGLQLGSTTRPGNNVIIRNITFMNASDNSVSVTNSAHHVWIDHNSSPPASTDRSTSSASRPT